LQQFRFGLGIPIIQPRYPPCRTSRVSRLGFQVSSVVPSARVQCQRPHGPRGAAAVPMWFVTAPATRCGSAADSGLARRLQSDLSRLCYLRTWARRRHRAQSSELSRSRELRLRTRRSHAKSKDGLFGAAISSTWDHNRGRESEARLPPTPADPLQLR